jgi:hypothetical protein
VAVKQILCLQKENVFQAFDRAVKTGVFPANAQLFPLKVGVPQPEAPAGFVTVGSILIRPREAFAIGVPIESPLSFEVGI